MADKSTFASLPGHPFGYWFHPGQHGVDLLARENYG
jgi:hypothetical protein